MAMLIAVAVMLIFADSISEFINRHPSMKILALSFLLLIGSLLVAEAFDQHVSKGYIYFAMAFALLIELLNMRFRKKQSAVAAAQPVRRGDRRSPSADGGERQTIRRREIGTSTAPSRRARAPGRTGAGG